MPDAVFLDTNILRNSDAKRFFGNTSKLQQISRLAQIYIPSIVIEEVKWQKRRKLRSNLTSFQDNYFFGLIECEADSLEAHIEKRIDELFENAHGELNFIECTLADDATHLEQLKNLALQNLAPFNPKDDKGFKDAYIYLTLRQYLELNSGHAFLITSDERLNQSFHNDQRVTVLALADDYFDYRSSYFSEPYFLDVLTSAYNEQYIVGDDEITFTEGYIHSTVINDDDEWVVELRSVGFSIDVFVDFYSREILRFQKHG